MKPVYVKSSMYFDFNKENNKEGPKFNVGDSVRISKYKNSFIKTMFRIGLKKFLWLIEEKNTVTWTYTISDLNGEEIVETFYETELQKTNQKEFRVERVLRRKGNKLHVKWKGYHSSFIVGLIKKTFFKTEIFWRKSESWIRFT